jgi:hypothetical protein
MGKKIQTRQKSLRLLPEEWLRACFPKIADWEISRLLPDLRRYYRVSGLKLETQIADDADGVKSKVREYRKLYKANGVDAPLPARSTAHEHGDVRQMIDISNSRMGNWLSPQEHARAEAMMRFWARLAELDLNVQEFRREVLGDETLPTLEAAAFLSSDALALFSRQELEELGVPLVGHTAQVSETTRTVDGDEITWRVTMRLMPPGITIERGYTEVASGPRAFIHYPDIAQEMFCPKQVRPGSVLHDLLCVSEPLARRYAWHEWDAPLFVVSGLIPRREPLEFSIQTSVHAGSGIQRFVTAKIEPHTSVKTVRDGYQRIQREAYGQRIPKPVSIRNARLFGYATRYMGEGGTLPPASERREIFEGWNDSQSETSMKFATLDEFNRAMRDTHRRFLRVHTDYGALYRQ